VQKKRIRIGMLSLGCPKTLVDSELALGLLNDKNYEIADSVTECDVALVNTCAFINEAREESIDKIVSLANLKNVGRIKKLVVMGCLAQKYFHDLKKDIPEIDAFVGTGDFPQIREVIQDVNRGHQVTRVGKPLYLYDSASPRFALTPSFYRYVKISEGCDHQCSFCIIPQLKGLHRSRLIHDVVSEVKQLGEDKVKEVILTGQDTTFYGRDFAKKFLLADLLKELDAIDSISWIRLLYAYPVHLSNEILETIAGSKKICNYIDVPLQHISDPMLKSMNRKAGKQFIQKLVKRIRDIIPNVAIRTTFIVGFPGETQSDFRELLEFIEESQFERMGVFTYSLEDYSTSASLSGHLPEEVKEERLHEAMTLQRNISSRNNKKWMGQDLEVLIEGSSNDKQRGYVGRSFMDAPDVDGSVYVKTESKKILKPGDLVQCRITDSYEYDLAGKCLS